MNRFGHYIIVVLLALIAGSIGATLVLGKNHSVSEKKETAYERVLRTGTLRCGYIIWPPEFKKDINTGQFSGIAYDIMTGVAKRLNWKIDWVEEVNFTTMSAALKAKRFDGICFSLYRDSPRAVFSRFTAPLYYSGTGVFVRADDHRFDTINPYLLNDAQYRVATMDGEMSAITARNRFPKTQQVSLPNTANPTDLLLNVVTGKADFTLMNTGAASEFMAKNPGQIRNIAAKYPAAKNAYYHVAPHYQKPDQP